MKKSPWVHDTNPKFVYLKMWSIIHIMLLKSWWRELKAAIIRGTSEVDWWLNNTNVRWSIRSQTSKTREKLNLWVSWRFINWMILLCKFLHRLPSYGITGGLWISSYLSLAIFELHADSKILHVLTFTYFCLKFPAIPLPISCGLVVPMSVSLACRVSVS